MKKKLTAALTSVCLLLALTIPVHAAVMDTGFSDVASWYADAVAYCRDNGLMSGATATTFSPDMATSRAMLVTILYRQAVQQFYEPQTILMCRPVLGMRMLYRWLNSGGGKEDPVAPTPDDESISAENTMIDLKITVAGQVFTAKLYDNESTQALLHQLPLTVCMGELNGNEKYYFMPVALPTNSERPGEIHTGDFMLYGSDCLVLFYQNFFSSYSYTRLGYIEDVEGFAQAVGNGSVSVSFEYEM